MEPRSLTAFWSGIRSEIIEELTVRLSVSEPPMTVEPPKTVELPMT